MTRVYVIDPDARPSRDYSREPWVKLNAVHPFDAGFRIMECETIGWVSGNVVLMVIHGNTAIRPMNPKPLAHVERWQVFDQPGLGGWVAWVRRPDADDRARRELNGQRIELLIVGAMVLLAGVIGALILIVLPQCQGGL